MPHSEQLPNPNAQIDTGWSWLQSQLESADHLLAAHRFDEWIDEQLNRLELEYRELTTDESIKASLGKVVGSARKPK